MKREKLKLYYVFKILVSSILFYASLKFENVAGKRLVVLAFSFIIYILIGVIRESVIKKERLYLFSFLIDVGVIFFLESNSKYLINYFLHIFYILILLEASLLLRRKQSFFVSIITLGVSLSKYFILIYYKRSLSSVSEMMFFGVISIFIVSIIYFSQYYKEEKEKKDVLYAELLSAHKNLKEYSEKVERLATIEERNRIARDIHDTLGHDMTALLMQLELASRFIDKDINQAKNILLELKDSTRENLVKVREIVQTLNPDEDICKGIKSIEELVEEFCKKTGVKANLNIEGDMVKANPSVNITIYRIVQESMTNAVRHGKANEINIIIRYMPNRISFRIYNNGLVEKEIKEGFGLKAMRERVETLDGRIYFSNDEMFTVEGFLPLEVKGND
ncbi:MAG: sensor histidine kinase [Gottschalkiaceae bacterium]|nr:MAG: sensor histidine kinase [Gottschalkiaceae bacterium]